MLWSKIALSALFTTTGLFATYAITHRIATKEEEEDELHPLVENLKIDKEYEWDNIVTHVLDPYLTYIIKAAFKCEDKSRSFSLPDFIDFDKAHEKRKLDWNDPFTKALSNISGYMKFHDNDTQLMIKLIRSNAYLKQIYKRRQRIDSFSLLYEMIILRKTYIVMVDKTAPFMLIFLTILQPMFKSLSKVGNGHANINMYVTAFTGITFDNGVVGIRNNDADFGEFNFNDFITRCWHTRTHVVVNMDSNNEKHRVERDIFTVNAPEHVFAVVYEKYGDKETLYSLDNIDDDYYMQKYKVTEMHKKVLLEFQKFFDKAVVGIAVEEETHYNICFTEGIDYDTYRLDCSYIMYRHCILLHILPPVEELMKHISPSSIINIANFDRTLHKNYKDIFAHIWNSLMTLYKNAHNSDGFLICPNMLNECIIWDSLFEINRKTKKVTRWRYDDDFQFAEVQRESDRPLEICTLQANMLF